MPYHRTYPANRYSSSLEDAVAIALRKSATQMVEPIGIEPMT